MQAVIAARQAALTMASTRSAWLRYAGIAVAIAALLLLGRQLGAALPGLRRLGRRPRRVGTGRLRRRLRARRGRLRARLGADARGRRDLRTGARNPLRVRRRGDRLVGRVPGRALPRAALGGTATRRESGIRGDRPRDRATGTPHRVPAAALAGVPVQPAELRARAHARALRRRAGGVARDAARARSSTCTTAISRARWRRSPAARPCRAAPATTPYWVSASSRRCVVTTIVTRTARRALREATEDAEPAAAPERTEPA